MADKSLSRSTSSLVRSKSLRLPSKSTDVIQENIRNVSTLSRSGSLRDRKQKDMVVSQANRKRDDVLSANANQDNRDKVMSKSCYGSLTSTNGELKRGTGTFSFRRPFSRGSPTEKKHPSDPKRFPISPTTATRPMRDYAADLKHLIAEHLDLQQEYAKVRQQLVERCLERAPMSPVSDLSSIPELEADTGSSVHSEREIIIRSKRSREDAATEAYRREVLRLQVELHRMQKLYWNQIIQNDRHERDESGRIVIDLLNQLEVHRSELYDNKSKIRKLEDQLGQSVREIATCRDALNDYQIELQGLRRQLKEATAELVETKENLQFAEDELRTMSDSLREAERERKESAMVPNSKIENHINGIGRQSVQENRFLQLHNVLLRLGQKIEALVREDCLFAEEQLDLSEDVLRVLAGTPFVDEAFETKDDMALDSARMTDAEEKLAESVSQVVTQCVHLRDLMRARSQEKLKTNEDQILELKKSLDLMCRRHSDSEEQIRVLSQALQRSQSELNGLSDQAEKWRVEHRNEVERLTRVIEEAKERNRCLHAVNLDQARQLNGEITSLCASPGEKDVIISSASIRDNLLLKQEFVCYSRIECPQQSVLRVICVGGELEIIKELQKYVKPFSGTIDSLRWLDGKESISKLREEAATKDDLLRAFHRSRQLWEDNYQRVRLDLRIRDQQLDSVLDVLKGLPEIVDQCRPLKMIYSNLTDPNTKPIGKKLGVTNSVVASAV